MSSINKTITQEVFQRRVRLHYGDINHKPYVPFFTAHDDTLSTRFRYNYKGRMFTIRGSNNFYFLLDRLYNLDQERISAIYENALVDQESALTLAQKAHKTLTRDKDGNPRPIVTPFVIDYREDDGRTRRTAFCICNRSSDGNLKDRHGSFYNNLAIQKLFWESPEINASFEEYDARQLSDVRAHNIQMLLNPPACDLSHIPEEAFRYYEEQYNLGKQSILKISEATEHRFCLPTGYGNELFRYLAASHKIHPDIDSGPISYTEMPESSDYTSILITNPSILTGIPAPGAPSIISTPEEGSSPETGSVPEFGSVKVGDVYESKDPELSRQLMHMSRPSGPQPSLFRVLKINSGEIYTISLDGQSDTEKPRAQSAELIYFALESGTLCPAADPYLPVSSPSMKLQQKRDYLARLFEDNPINDMVIEDRNGEYNRCISKLVKADKKNKTSLHESSIVDILTDEKDPKDSLSKVLRDEISEKEFKRFLTAWWRGGMLPDALITKQQNQQRSSGIRNALRSAEHQRTPEKRRSEILHAAPLKEKNADAADFEHFFDIIDTEWAKNPKLNLTQAYERYLNKYCKTGKDELGDAIFLPPDQIPSISQFKAYAIAYINARPEHYLRKRLSGTDFDLQYRPVLSHEDSFCPGPGSVFAADGSDLLDTKLVDSASRHLNIGKPNVIILIDLYSRAITGLACQFDGENLFSYRAALHCAATADKEEYFKRLGVTTRNENWPAAGIPAAILSDNGPMLSKDAAQFCRNCGITLINAQSHRGDQKGVIESSFHTIHMCLKAFMRGVVDARQRLNGGHNYDQDACLTYREYLQIVVDYIGVYNRSHRIHLIPEADFFSDNELEMNPLSLWKHGMKYRAYDLRKVDPYILNIRLLPEAEASFSRNGLCLDGYSLHYKDENYSREFARTNDRFIGKGALPRLPGDSGTIRVHFSTMIMDRVFQYDEETHQVIEWILTGGDGKLMYGKGYAEIKAIQNEMKRLEKDQEQRSIRAVNGLVERTQSLVSQAMKETKQSLGRSRLDLNHVREGSALEQIKVSNDLLSAQFDLYPAE